MWKPAIPVSSCASLVAIAVATCATPVWAQSELTISGSARASGSTGGGGGLQFDDADGFSQTSQIGGVLVDAAGAAGGLVIPDVIVTSGQATATAQVRQGYIRLAATASALIEYPTYAASYAASAEGSFMDTVTISNPALTGQIGTFTPTLRVEVSGSSVGEYSGTYSMGFAIGDQAGGINGDFFGGTNFIIPIEIAPVSFVYGQPFTIAVSAGVYAGLSGSAEDNRFVSGGISAAFPGSIQWMGMTGLESGSSVTQGAIDWTQAAPVPAPSSAALLAGALAMGGPTALRRRR